MKKIIFIFCFAYIAANITIAQSIHIDSQGIRIENPSDNETRHHPKPKSTHNKAFFSSIGFIVPNNGSGYFTTLGGSSINLDFGRMHRYQVAPQFELGRTLQYSYYNYRSWNMASNPEFVDEVIGREFNKHGIRKQVFRSHNIAASFFTRFYLVPDKNRLHIDLGVQGDFAFSKYYKIKTESEGKRKYRNDYAFNPFSASAIARAGWNRKKCSCTWNGNCCWNNNSRAIFVRYRFTDAFNQKALPMDLPQLTIGIQFFY